MDDISNIINFDVNENCPNADNDKGNVSNSILSGKAENKLSNAELVAFNQNSPLSEKHILTSANNNSQSEKLISIIEENSICALGNNSEENITFLTAPESINDSSLLFNETTCIEAVNNISTTCLNNSFKYENECLSNSFVKDTNLSSSEIPVGNCSFLSKQEDNLRSNSTEVPICTSHHLPDVSTDNQKNMNDGTIKSKELPLLEMENINFVTVVPEELKDDKDNSIVVVEKHSNAANDMLGNFTTVDSICEIPKMSVINTITTISDIKPTLNMPESKNISTSVELFETDANTNVPENAAKNCIEEFAKSDVENFVALGDSNDNDSPLKVSEKPIKETINDISLELEMPSTISQGIFIVHSDLPDSSTGNAYKKINKDEVASQVPENHVNNKLEEISPLKIGMVDVSDKFQEQFTDLNIAYKMPQTTPISPMKQFVDSDIASKVPEVSSDIAFKEPEIPSNNPVEQSADPDIACKVPEIAPNNLIEQCVDPDVAFKVPEVPSNNPVEESADPDIAFKVPEIKPCNPVEQLDSDIVFKIPEVPSCDPAEQFSDTNTAFKVPEVPSDCPLEQFLDSDFAVGIPKNHPCVESDEAFVDAVQFFKDPNSFQFLENIRTSTVQPGSSVPRSSLYVNFDPLHSKFPTNMPKPDACALISTAMQENNDSVYNTVNNNPEVINKQLVDVAAHESLGNTLISFDSPKQPSCVDSKTPVKATSPNMFTEEELQQKLKIHELETQEAYLKKQREMEMKIAGRDQLLKSERILIEEFYGILVKSTEEVRKYQEKIMSLETENEKLKEDLKTSTEEIQSVENTFADFYKRYEQCKGMLKTYKENEEHLKQQILDLQTKANEQSQMYHKLQERTEEMLEKANVEVDNVKRTGEAQATVLKAQLKKAEMKISSLESDIKQIKIENSELGGICDDLMAKVSRS